MSKLGGTLSSAAPTKSKDGFGPNENYLKCLSEEPGAQLIETAVLDPQTKATASNPVHLLGASVSRIQGVGVQHNRDASGLLLQMPVSCDETSQEPKPASRKRPGKEAPGSKSPKKMKATAQDKPLIACPYYKRNPQQYRKCGQATIKENTDMRRHLGRYHMQPLHCPTCKLTFGSMDDDECIERRNKHIREKICKPTDNQIPGVTEDQWRALQACSKKRGSKSSTWFETWRILFPKAPGPRTNLLTLEDPVQDAVNKFLQDPNQVSAETRPGHDVVLRKFVAYLRSYETSPAGSSTPTVTQPPGHPVTGAVLTQSSPSATETAEQMDDFLHIDSQFDQSWPEPTSAYGPFSRPESDTPPANYYDEAQFGNSNDFFPN